VAAAFWSLLLSPRNATPRASSTAGMPTLFDAESEGTPAALVFEAVERREDDVLWLRYRRAPAPRAGQD